MSSTGLDNPFAPPRALVEDAVSTEATMEPATRVTRLVAAIIDGLAIGGVVAVIGIAAAVVLPAWALYNSKHTPTQPGLSTSALMVVVGLLAAVAMIALFIVTGVLVYRYGQTIGKRVMGIRVVRADGRRVAFGRFVFLRWLPLFLAGLIPMVGYLIGLVDSLLIFRETRQCLHDTLADTMVVTAASSRGATLAASRRAAVS